MKRKIAKVLLVGVLTLAMCGCSSNDSAKKEADNQSKKTESNKKESLYDTLTDEQKNYLLDVLGMLKEEIDDMDYESINWNLLGTGFELYNQSSGVEVFGVTYEESESIVDVSESDKIITYNEVRDICLKGKEMRLNDFATYKYTIIPNPEDTDNSYIMEIPMSDYESTFVTIVFKRKDNNIIHMNSPFILHENGETDYVFSPLYDKDSMEAYYEMEPKYSWDNKKYIEVQYTSVTDNSLVIELYNYANEDFKLKKNYEIYEIDSEGEKLIDSSEGKEDTIKAKWYLTESIKLNEGVTLSEDKTYRIKFGIDKEGYFYDDVIFQKG